MNRYHSRALISGLSSLLLAMSISACGGRVSPERDAERERSASQGGGYCDFVSAVEHPDVEVELSLRLGKRCDLAKSFSLTEYRTEKNNNGILFCCVGMGKRAAASTPLSVPAVPEKTADKKPATGSNLNLDQ